MSLYDFRCEYCEGTVREQILKRHPFNHARGVVILEQVPLGVCDRCHAYYYPAAVLHRVESILSSTEPPERTVQVPVETY
jgi:YgiT-type zinc finger domain-containing protein